MEFESILEELWDPDLPIAASKLVHLSDLGPEEMQRFKEGWLEIPTERRRKVASTLSDLAEDNVELDFSVIFRHSLTDDDEDLRVIAIEGLWECQERSLIGPLIRLLNDDQDDRVRAAAAQALGRFALLAETGNLLDRDATRVGNALLDVIDSEEETLEVRRRSIEGIAPMSIGRVSEVIQEAYEDEDLSIRASALHAMGLNCDPKWLPVLSRELSRDEPQLRYEAVGAMGLIGEEEAVPQLTPLIFDPDAQVQAAVFNAIGSIGGPVAKTVLPQALKHSDPRIVKLAEEALQLIEVEEEPLGFRERGRPSIHPILDDLDEDLDDDDEDDDEE